MNFAAYSAYVRLDAKMKRYEAERDALVNLVFRERRKLTSEEVVHLVDLFSALRETMIDRLDVAADILIADGQATKLRQAARGENVSLAFLRDLTPRDPQEHALIQRALKGDHEAQSALAHALTLIGDHS